MVWAMRLLPLALVLLAGCYQSHERGSIPGRDGGRDAGAFDAGPRRDAGDVTLPDAGPVGCDVWEPVAPVQISDQEGDNTPLDAEHTGPGYLVAWSTTNPMRDRSRYATLTPLGGPVGERHVLFPPPAPVSLGTGLAVHDGAIAATQSDERGCRFRRVLAPDGSMVGAPRSMAGVCNGLFAHSRGWTVFDRDASTATLLQPDGTPSSTVDAPVLDEVYWWTRVRQAENSYLIVGLIGGLDPFAIHIQRVDRAGASIGPPTVLMTPRSETRPRGVSTSEGALIGRLAPPLGEPDSQHTTMLLFPTDPNGVPSFTELEYEPTAYRDAGWGMVRIGDSIFLVYVEPEPGDRFGEATRLRALRIDERGELLEEPITIAEGRFLRNVLARTDGRELFVAYSASVPGGTQVFGAGLRCVR